MKKVIISMSLVLAALGGLTAQEKEKKPAPPTPTFPTGVEMVTVDVVVANKKGAPVTGLTKDDFVVTEDGARQTVASFEAIVLAPAPSAKPLPKPRVSTNATTTSRAGRGFVVLFDDVQLTPANAQRAKAAVTDFLKKGVREGDRVTLISTGGDAWWTARMEAGRDELIGLLKRLEGRRIPDVGRERVSDYEAMRIHVYSDSEVTARVTRRFTLSGVITREGQSERGDPYVRGRAAEVYMQSVSRNKTTLGILERALKAQTSIRGRKSLILISGGFIYDPSLPEFKDVVEASRRANCAIYFVDTRGLTGMSDYFTAEFGPAIPEEDLGAAFVDTWEASAGTEALASDSGGFSVRNTNDLGKGIQRIADDSRAYYLLGYHPANVARDGRYRKIKVAVPGKKGIEIRARKGYFAPLERGGKAKTADSAPNGPDPRFQEAVDSPYDMGDIPMRMTAFVFEETLLGKAKVLVTTEADIGAMDFEEKDGRFEDELGFLLVAAHRQTGEYFRYDQKVELKLLPETREKLTRTWFPIVREFELAPGSYQAKIVVRDTNSGRLGTVTHEFEVPIPNEFRMSTPLISDVLQKASVEAGERPYLTPGARRTFAPATSLYCQYEIYGAVVEKGTAVPRVSAGYVIRSSDGTTVSEMAPSIIKPTSLGKLSRLFGLLLPDGPGEYEMTITAKDELSGRSLEQREPFTITAAN